MTFVRCPLCHDIERSGDMVGGVCLTCADAIAFSQNARRGAVVVRATDPLYVEDADDEPWRVLPPDRPESRWLVVLRIITAVVALAVIALLARR